MERPNNARYQTSLILLCLLCLSPSFRDAGAATWLVRPDQSGDVPTIQAAVDAAASGDTVSLDDGTFTGDGNKNIQIYGKAIAILSLSNDPAVCVIDCEAVAPDFHHAFVIDSVGGPGVPGDAPVLLQGMTITRADGHLGGAVVGSRSGIEIRDCIFDDNFATYGGGLFVTDSCVVTLTGCVFSDNEAVGDGAISFYGVEMSASDCLFIRNGGYADGPGAVWGRDGTVSFERCAFIDNWAKYGGAVDLSYDLTSTLSNCTFAGNWSQLSDGSAISNSWATLTTIERSIFAFNGPGAAISGCGDSLWVGCSDFYGNIDGDWDEWTDCLDSAFTMNGNFVLNPLFCDTLAGDCTLASLSPCLPANNTCSVLVGAYDLGCTYPTAIGEDRPAAMHAVGLRAVPNPFNPRTTISYTLAQGAYTTLCIYDVGGRRIRSLVAGFETAGLHEVEWNGRTDAGRSSASGTYFVRLVSGGVVSSAKISMLK
jgi:hypothetical protein